MINGNFFIEQQHGGRLYIVAILHDPDNYKLNTLVSYDVWNVTKRYTMKILHIITQLLIPTHAHFHRLKFINNI